MGQITAIAQALTGNTASAPPVPPPTEPQDVEFVPVEGAETDKTQKEPTAELSSLLNALGNPSMPNIDPKLISIAMQVFSEYSAQNDDKVVLLSALKPFLKAERLEKMEKAEKIARLSRVVKTALRLLKEESGNV